MKAGDKRVGENVTGRRRRGDEVDPTSHRVSEVSRPGPPGNSATPKGCQARDGHRSVTPQGIWKRKRTKATRAPWVDNGDTGHVLDSRRSGGKSGRQAGPTGQTRPDAAALTSEGSDHHLVPPCGPSGTHTAVSGGNEVVGTASPRKSRMFSPLLLKARCRRGGALMT
jgi:hypothetical protein